MVSETNLRGKASDFPTHDHPDCMISNLADWLILSLEHWTIKISLGSHEKYTNSTNGFIFIVIRRHSEIDTTQKKTVRYLYYGYCWYKFRKYAIPYLIIHAKKKNIIMVKRGVMFLRSWAKITWRAFNNKVWWVWLQADVRIDRTPFIRIWNCVTFNQFAVIPR